jgi:outer membrane biosynthesis protein TonB
MEATRMKVLGLISTTALFLLFGATVPAFAQEEHHDEGAKPAKQEEQAKPAAKQEQAKPEKQEQQPKEVKQEEQAKPAKQEEAKPEKQQAAKPQKQEEQQAKSEQKQSKEQPVQKQQQAGQGQQSQGQYAKNGQKDREGHEYNQSRFGPNHHARFEENGGRYNNGRREYSYGGYWFYAGAYPAWFYQQDVYFVLGTDGLWYAVAYGNPSLTFQVNIG